MVNIRISQNTGPRPARASLVFASTNGVGAPRTDGDIPDDADIGARGCQP